MDSNLNVLFTQNLTEREIRTFDINQKGQLYLSFHEKNVEIYQFEEENRKLVNINSFEGHADIISAIFIDEKMNLLYTGSQDHSIFVWDLKTNQYKHNLIGHKDLISSFDVNNERSLLVSSSWD